MHKPSVGLAPEGLPFILLTAFTTLIFAILDCWFLALLGLITTWLAGHFFRDPERVPPEDPSLAVSPADGKVIRIESRPDPFDGTPKICVSIFMNLFSVHVNRSPVSGTVRRIRYLPGKFFNASLDKASNDNERCAWELETPSGSLWSMVQIAGLVARRIVPHAETGDTLVRGQRYGLIRFGSRVDLYLPEDYSPCVQLGDQVHAGESAIARPAAN